MGQALYRRYRSKNLAEIIGQEHITKTLAKAIERNAVSHAYLLTGPRGVGKTSIARILAHQINELPYEGEKIHLDIIEIDAASNRRIDEIRDLRDKVHNAPTSAKYKVYIIDEVHMLTREAFNALLKTLEEPPAHAIFILATTDVHKLPDTIISRTQHFTFKPIAEVRVAEHLQQIANKEEINIAPDALNLIARHGGGSFRDSISLLEQAAGLGDKVSLDDVQRMLGVPPQEYIDQLHEAAMSGRASAIVETLEDLAVRGYQAEQVASQLTSKFREDLISGAATNPSQSVNLIKELLEVPSSHDPRSLLEIILLGSVTQKLTDATATKSVKIERNTELPVSRQNNVDKNKDLEAKETKKQQEDKPVSEISAAEKEPRPKPSKTKEVTELKKTDNAKVSEELWNEALQELKKTHSTLYSVARMADFACDTDTITLNFKFAFHQKRIETAKNKQIISDIVARLCGKEIAIVCRVSETKAENTKEKPKTKEENSPLETISNIFGGGEMLES